MPPKLGTVWTAKARIRYINEETMKWVIVAVCIDVGEVGSQRRVYPMTNRQKEYAERLRRDVSKMREQIERSRLLIADLLAFIEPIAEWAQVNDSLALKKLDATHPAVLLTMGQCREAWSLINRGPSK